jgi:hypothetical protein
MDNYALFWDAKEDKPAKAPRTIRSCPFKASRPPKEGWLGDDSGCFGLSPLDQLWELVLEGPQVSLGFIRL